MEERQPNKLEQLRATLAANAEDFVLLSTLPDTAAHAQFIGRFEGRDVVWDMHLYTLQRYWQERDAVPAAADLSLRGFMNIAPGIAQVYRLEVALNVALIDAPTIKKTIMMIRHYRMLRVGQHRWGDNSV